MLVGWYCTHIAQILYTGLSYFPSVLIENYSEPKGIYLLGKLTRRKWKEHFHLYANDECLLKFGKLFRSGHLAANLKTWLLLIKAARNFLAGS